MNNNTIICFDLGTTSSKYIIKKDYQIILHNTIDFNDLDNLIEQYSNDKSFNYILITGTNSSKYKSNNKIIIKS